MDEAVATAILAAYPRRKMKLADAAVVVHAWLRAAGIGQDRWGNYKENDTNRFKLTKQRLQRQVRSGGDWRNTRSTPLLEAALNLVQIAAKVLGDETVLQKASGAKTKRKDEAQERAVKAKEEALRREVMGLVAKAVSAEMPDEFAVFHDTGSASPEFEARYSELVHTIQSLRRLGKPPSDQDLFSSFEPPLAPLLMDLDAQWVEEVRGVPYTVTVRHADSNRAVVEIGYVGRSGIGTQVDPIRGWATPSFESREGDGYLSGWVKRGKDGPVGALFLLQSQDKQQGAGGRILDLWCNLMASYGVRHWVAQGVGEEGQAFLAAKVRSGRLLETGREGSQIVMQCLGGPEGKQPMLPGLTPNVTRSGEYAWDAEAMRKELLDECPDVQFPDDDDPNPLYHFWLWYGRGRKTSPLTWAPLFTSFSAREYAVKAWAWAVPSSEIIEDIVKFSEGFILEVGAGRGYWAKLLAAGGADIIATDPYPPEGTFYPVDRLKDAAAVSMFGRGRTLLLIWPPYDMSVAYDALRAFEKIGGTRMIYVGEGYGGCTADNVFFQALGHREYNWIEDKEGEESEIEQFGWRLVETDIDLPNWYSIHDSVHYYERPG